MFEYYENDHFEIPEKYLKMNQEELHNERLRLYLEDAKAGKMKLHIGDRVIVDKNCFERYNDWTENPCGTIIQTSTSAWDDIGGIYKLQLDNGEKFNCSIDAIKEVTGWIK